MMEQNNSKIWKFFIALSVILFAFSSAAAICDAQASQKCGDYCVHSSSTGCSGATIKDANCADVGCSNTCWGFWSNGGDPSIYQNRQNNVNKYHEDCTNLNVDVCVGPDGRTDYPVSSDKYYYPNGTEINCPQTNLPRQMYSEVALMSIPLHITFGIKDSLKLFNNMPAAMKTLGCGSILYGKGRPLLTCTTGSTYETHNTTRYYYDFRADFDAIVTVSDRNTPVPVLVGRNLTINSGIPNAFEKLCAGNNLCYTDIMR